MGFAKSGNRILLDKVRLLDIFRRGEIDEQRSSDKLNTVKFSVC
jgi:hypothetical protein